MLTFLDVRRLVADYASRGGACADTKTVELFARQVLEYIMLNGAYGSIRRFSFLAQQGCISLPYELETPLQVKIDRQVGSVWNQWMTLSSVQGDLTGCLDAHNVLEPLPNPAFTAFDLPPGGSVVGVLGTCQEEAETYIIVQGKDPTGREIVTTYKGEQIVGEKFPIKKNVMGYGQVKFGEITGIIKTPTKGYVQIWAVEPNTKQSQFLGDYSPLDEKPSYKKVRITGCSCSSLVEVVVQGRIRLKGKYVDNDIVPFDSMNTIIFAAQKLQAENNNNVQVANYKGGVLKDMIENEAAYKRVNPGTPVNTFRGTSGGAVKGIVRRVGRIF